MKLQMIIKYLLVTFAIIILIALIACPTSYAQESTRRIYTVATLPTVCKKSATATDTVVLFSSGIIYTCVNSVGVYPANWGAATPISGSGVANRVTFWSGASSLSSTSGFTFSSNNLSIPAGGQYRINGTAFNFSNLAGNIAVSQMNSGASASSSTFFRGDGTWQSISTGITNSAGANVITKSDGTNLVASRITDNGVSDAVVFDAGISVNGGNGGDEIFFAENNGGSINAAIGDLTEGSNGTYLRVDDANQIVTISAFKITPLCSVISSGTTGAQTINRPCGSVNFAAAATSLIVTNSTVSTSSVIICTVGTNDITLKSVQCVADSGSFTIYGNATTTTETRINFWILTP